jgi:outer membrane protein OmpA-like peptidoglycan-associated protein
MLDQEDDGTRIGVWVALGVVFFVLVGVIGGVILREMNQKAAAKASKPAAMAAAAEAMIDGPITGELVGKLYFDSGVAALPPDADPHIQSAMKALLTTPARTVVLSGFHDATGDAKRNAELAKQRALAVRKALVALGADAKRVLLRKPESTTGDGSQQEARRVEIRVVE